MTKQETFDTVARHLLTQNAKAIDGSGDCQYRAPDGKRCAAGCLIPDEEYSPEMEGESISRGGGGRATKVIRDLGHDLHLVRDLQNIHDCTQPEGWRHHLRGVASDYGLSPAVLDEVTP